MSDKPPIGRLGWLLAFGTGVVVLGQGAVGPVLPEYVLGFGSGAVGLAWAVAAFAVGRLAITVPTGIWESRFPMRPILTVGCFVTSIGVVATGLVSDFRGVIVTRFVAGVGSGIYMTAAILAIVRASRPETRARQIGFNQAALVGTVSVSPALGGYIAEIFGLRSAFIVVGLISFIGSILVMVLLPWAQRTAMGAPIATGEADDRGSRDQPLGWAVLVPLLAAGAVNFIIFGSRAGARQTILPLIGVERYEMSVGRMGVLFTVMSVVSLAVLQIASGLSDRLGRIQTILPGLFVSIAGFLVVPFVAGESLFWVGAVLIALGTSLAGPAPAAWAADLAPPARQGLVLSSFRMAGDAGSVLAPLALGWIGTVLSLDAAMVVQGVAFVAVAVVVAAVWRFESRGVLAGGGGPPVR